MSDSPPIYVLDGFAMLAYLEEESGMWRIEEILRGSQTGAYRAVLSVINLGEVLYITEREDDLAHAHEVLAAIEQLPIEILPASTEAVFAAAHIKANHRISYADAFAVAAALKLNGTIVTGDPEFEAVKDTVMIEWLPRLPRVC